MSSYAHAQAASLKLSLVPIVFRQKALTLGLTRKSSQTLLMCHARRYSALYPMPDCTPALMQATTGRQLMFLRFPPKRALGSPARNWLRNALAPLCLSGQSFHDFCVSPIKNPVSLTIAQ
jgi:hypothetical protein